jgi:hypothetical protein
MLSAKAIINFVLLAIVVPRVIRTSMSSKSVHGSEVRLNYLGAEISLAVSIVGVLGVALAFKFWMLLAGKHIDMVVSNDVDLHSTQCLRSRISTPSLHDVTR